MRASVCSLTGPVASDQSAGEAQVAGQGAAAELELVGDGALAPLGKLVDQPADPGQLLFKSRTLGPERHS
jgi:hypothetical protein